MATEIESLKRVLDAADKQADLMEGWETRYKNMPALLTRAKKDWYKLNSAIGVVRHKILKGMQDALQSNGQR